jgi:alpha-tubulin suppressor-like RCC1 family protein
MQVSAGYSHTVFLCSDGRAVAVGDNSDGQCNIPMLTDYVQVSAGGIHTALLLRDGRVLIIGNSMSEDEPEMTRFQFDPWSVPRPADRNIRYVAVSAGESRTALLRSDGSVIILSRDSGKNFEVPLPGANIEFVQVSVGGRHTVLLCSDGSARAIGNNQDGRCDIPVIKEPGVTYIQVSAGRYHTVLLRSDGIVLAVGRNDEHQCDMPDLCVQRTVLPKGIDEPSHTEGWDWWLPPACRPHCRCP